MYIATCNAGFVVDLFHEAGAKHVIGVKTGDPASDSAALTFTRSFYMRLWESGSKLCVCYERAIVDIRLLYDDAEADKFIILKSNNHKTEDCSIFGNFHSGKPTFTEAKPLLWDIPPPVNLVGMVDNAQSLIDNFFRRDSPH